MPTKTTRKRVTPSTPTVSTVPHSWPLSNWPPNVYPNDRRKALYLVRMQRAELLQAGAIVRVGRELVLIGEPYVRWLAKRATYVPGFTAACNRVLPAA
jgi:hypothetical protein